MPRKAAAVLCFLLLFSCSFSAYLETVIDRHSAVENDVVNVHYSFENFHGSGYLRIYAVKCAIAEKINCTFSDNEKEFLLWENKNFTFEGGTAEIIIPGLEFGLYRMCSKAYNHTHYATDCDSEKYIMIKNENSCGVVIVRDEPDLKVSIIDYPKNVSRNSAFEVTANLTNPQASEKNVTAYSYVYRYNGTTELVSQQWTKNSRQITVPAFSTVNFALENTILKDVEGDFILKVRVKFDEKERDAEMPVRIEKTRNSDLKVIAYSSDFSENISHVNLEIANYGEAPGKLNIILLNGNETYEKTAELKPKTQEMHYFEVNSSKFHIAVMSNTTLFSKYFEFAENKTHENKSYTAVTARTVEAKKENAFKDFYILPVLGVITLLLAVVLTK